MITRVLLTRGRRVRGREGVVRKEAEAGVTWGQEARDAGAARSWKKQGNGFSLKPPEEAQPCQPILDL